MKKRTVIPILFGAILLSFQAASCTPIPPSVPPTPTSQPAQNLSPTPTQAASSIPISTNTATPSGTSVISSENITQLTSASITLPSYVQALSWPTNDMVLAQSENGLIPAHLSPLSVGSSLPVSTPGRLLSLAPDGSSVAAISQDGNVGLFDLQGKSIREFNANSPYFANFSPDGKWLAIGLQNEMTVFVFNISDGKLVNKLSGFQTAAPVYGASVTPGGKTLVWIARATVQFQDISSGQMGQRLNFQDFVIDTAFSPDGSQLALNVGGELNIYSLPDAKLITKITLSQPARSLAYSPDGKILALGYGTSIQTWETAKWNPLPLIPGTGAAIIFVSFSPDGQRLVSVEDNNGLKVWTVQSK